jgi:hypothetical protein
MRVDPSTNAQIPIALPQAEATASRTASRTPATSGSGSPADSGSFVMTGQLSQLLAAVRGAPDVRSEAIASASAKLASGELDTPQAANETASAMLNDEESPDS